MNKAQTGIQAGQWTMADLLLGAVSAALIPILLVRTIDLVPSYTSVSLAGVVVLYVFCFHRLRHLVALASLTLFYTVVVHALMASASLWFLPVPMSGVAAVSLIAFHWAVARGAKRGEIGRMGILVVAVLAFLVLRPLALHVLMRPVNVLQRTYDGILLNWDHSLGIDAGFLLGRVVFGHRWLTLTCLGFYYALPCCLFVCLTNHLRSPWRFLAKIALAPVLAFGCYLLLPAAGPIYAFPNFPWALPALAKQFVYVPADSARNCVPSMHFAWAILLFTNSRGWQRAIAAVFLFFTFLSTLGLGEHYLFDLILALPLCSLTEAILQRRYQRCAISAALILAPIMAARMFLTPPDLLAGWAWAILTVSVPVALYFDGLVFVGQVREAPAAAGAGHFELRQPEPEPQASEW